MVMPSLSITPMGLGTLQGEAFSSMLEWGEHVFEVWWTPKECEAGGVRGGTGLAVYVMVTVQAHREAERSRAAALGHYLGCGLVRNMGAIWSWSPRAPRAVASAFRCPPEAVGPCLALPRIAPPRYTAHRTNQTRRSAARGARRR
jgi:hypothetical protein